ncbi:hypothetical protein Tco_0587696 [Tanacetum coccineum]
MMNFILQGIPNDIYNFEDACKNAQQMLERIRRLMHGFEKTKRQRYARLVDEFDKFFAVEGESLSYVYERLITLVNVMDRNEIRPLPITINTKFFNSIQLEWSKYVTMTPKKASRNHDSLALVAHSNVHSSQSHASLLYSYSSQPYYVTHPSLLVDYEEDYQWKIQGDAQEDKLKIAMMNQVVIHDGRVDIQSKNVGYVGNVFMDHTNHAKLKTVINTSDDDQNYSSIIFDDPYGDNNGGKDEHDSNAHDQSITLESLI